MANTKIVSSDSDDDEIWQHRPLKRLRRCSNESSLQAQSGAFSASEGHEQSHQRPRVHAALGVGNPRHLVAQHASGCDRTDERVAAASQTLAWEPPRHVRRGERERDHVDHSQQILPRETPSASQLVKARPLASNPKRANVRSASQMSSIPSKDKVKTGSSFRGSQRQIKSQRQGRKRKAVVKKNLNNESCLGSSFQEDGFCPICQAPFNSIHLKTTKQHIQECLQFSEPENECPAGVTCDSVILSHYQKFSHGLLALVRSETAACDQSQQHESTGPAKSIPGIAKQELEMPPFSDSDFEIPASSVKRVSEKPKKPCSISSTPNNASKVRERGAVCQQLEEMSPIGKQSKPKNTARKSFKYLGDKKQGNPRNPEVAGIKYQGTKSPHAGTQPPDKPVFPAVMNTPLSQKASGGVRSAKSSEKGLKSRVSAKKVLPAANTLLNYFSPCSKSEGASAKKVLPASKALLDQFSPHYKSEKACSVIGRPTDEDDDDDDKLTRARQSSPGGPVNDRMSESEDGDMLDSDVDIFTMGKTEYPRTVNSSVAEGACVSSLNAQPDATEMKSDGDNRVTKLKTPEVSREDDIPDRAPSIEDGDNLHELPNFSPLDEVSESSSDSMSLLYMPPPAMSCAQDTQELPLKDVNEDKAASLPVPLRVFDSGRNKLQEISVSNVPDKLNVKSEEESRKSHCSSLSDMDIGPDSLESEEEASPSLFYTPGTPVDVSQEESASDYFTAVCSEGGEESKMEEQAEKLSFNGQGISSSGLLPSSLSSSCQLRTLGDGISSGSEASKPRRQGTLDAFLGCKPLPKAAPAQMTQPKGQAKGRWKGANQVTSKPRDYGEDQRQKEWVNSSGRQCPFYKKMPSTSFTVDAFRYGIIPGCKAYFLSHFHYDHYGGLTKYFNQQLYCSKVTGNLVISRIKVPECSVTCLPMNEPCVVDGVEVTLLDANHCPGSVMFLFRLRSGATYLHTGDFRADASMEQYPQLIGCHVNQLYLDTTYCNPSYKFPTQREVIQFAVDTAMRAVRQNCNTLIVCGTYTIGKERVFRAIAEALGCKVYVEAAKMKVLECLEDSALASRLTRDAMATRLHVVAMGLLNHAKLKDYLSQFKPKYNNILAFKPTGWTHSDKAVSASDIKPSKSGISTIYGIPYSEHSSYSELRRFVQFVRADQILPTVNNRNPKSRKAMERIFEEWMASRETGRTSTAKKQLTMTVGNWFSK